MASLYEISADLLNVINGGMVFNEETGEILFDSDNLDDLEMAYADKLESCGLYVKNLQAEVDGIKAEEHRLADRRIIKERKAERLKEYMLNSMELTNTGKLDTSKVAISTRKSQKVIIDDERAIPLQFLKTVQSVNRAEVKKALKSGEVPGAHIEDSLNLQIK